MYEKSYNIITVDSSALKGNYAFMCSRTQSKVMAMVKADGYGHGMVAAAKAFQSAGCYAFGVAELREGIALRQAGLVGEIFVTLGFPLEDAALLVQFELTPVVYDFAACQALSVAATASGKEIAVHVKVDSGMGRLGLFPENVVSFVEALAVLPGLRFAGIMSHFPEADSPERTSTLNNYAAFAEVDQILKNRYGSISHIANSAGILNFPQTHCDMVRAGIALYGYHPAGGIPKEDDDCGILIPAMSYRTQILQIKDVPSGRGISYGHLFHTGRPSRIAVLPVGYDDGLSRSLSNIGECLVGGQRVPICGRICMNMCMVDVTDLEQVQAGDEAVLLGRQGSLTITADDIAEKVGSISYEVLCKLGNNNSRKYI